MPPVIAAAAAAAASYGVSVAVGTVVYSAVTLAATVGISAALAGASMLLAPDAPSFSQTAAGRTHSVRQPVSPRQLVYGRVRTGGPYVFITTRGDPGGHNKNKWLHIVLPLAAHEIESVDEVYFNDEKLDLDQNGYVTGGTYWESRTDWNPAWQRSMVRVKKYLGAPGQQADPDLIAATAGLPVEQRWGASCRGDGIAYLSITLEWNPKVFQSGIPNITAVIKGKKVEDPRTGLKVWSDNAALCIRDYLLTKRKDGGVGALPSELLNTNWVAQANICDEAIPLAAGGSEKRYTLNGSIELSKSNTPKNTLESMLTACGGNLVLAGGYWRLLVGAYRPPTFTLTDSHLRGPLQVQTKLSRRESYNAVKGTYCDPLNLWQPTDFPPAMSDTAMAEDGGHRVFREMDLPWTTSAATAQRLARLDLLKARQPITVQAQCKLSAFQAQCGDTIFFTRERQGWVNKPFLVTAWAFAPDQDGGLGIDLTLRETAPELYDFNTSLEQAVDLAPGTALPDWRNVPEVTNLSVDSSNSQVLIGADGSYSSRALVSWSASTDAFVNEYQVQWQVVGDADWTYSATTTSTSLMIEPLAVGAVINVRVRARNSLGVYGNFVTILNHTVDGFSGVPNPSVLNLKVVGSPAGQPGQFNTRDAVFTWDESGIGILKAAYQVQILDAVANTVRRTVEVTNPTYTYSYDDNLSDGGPRRSFRISVRVKDRFGEFSTATVLTATNPPAPLPTAVQLTGEHRTLSLRYTPPPDPDYDHLRVWRATTTGFTPSNANLIYSGPDTTVFMSAAPGTTYFVRFASVDAFGPDGLVVSAEQQVSTVRISHADLMDEVISSSNLYPDLQTTIGKIPVLETAITTEQTTRQGQVDALAQQIETVSAITALQTYRQDNPPTGTIPTGSLWFDTNDSNKIYRWNGSSWQLSEDARIVANTALIQAETTARTTAISAEATARQTLQTTVNGHTTSIQTQSQSLDGLSGQVYTKIDNNGYVSGYGLSSTSKNGTPTSDFIVSADRFSIAKPGTGGTGPIIPFIVSTARTPAVLSFNGVLSADNIISGTVDTDTIYLGGTRVVLDGPSYSIRVNNGVRDLVRIGRQVDNVNYGITINDSAGNLILSSTTGVSAAKITGSLPATQVSGLGTLATASTVTTAQISGLGSLATASSVPVNLVSGLGSFATQSQINQANATTLIGAAAINSAHIGNLSADKITSGYMRADAFIQAGNNVVLDGSNAGRFYITDPRSPGRLRVYAGHNPGVDYGFWLWDVNGTEIFGTSGLTGTYIRDLSVTNGKFANLTIGGEKIQDLAASNSVGGFANNTASYGVGMNVLGNRAITVIGVIRFALQGFTAENNNTAANYRNDAVQFQIVSNAASLTGMVSAGTVYGSNWTGTATIMHTFTPGGAPHSRNFFVQTSRAVTSINVWAIENRK